ncbi:MAG: protein kinase [Myxococcales bacterium]|nr:protein kinase [Myxococcales bacterium]
MSEDGRRARVGRYQLGPVIGEGGMGVVYRATLLGPTGFRKAVALKMLRSGHFPPGTLRREARLGGMIKHPNLVETWELGEVDGAPFLAMELVEGPDLERLLRDGPLPARAVVELGQQLATGLAHIHRPVAAGGPGLVHCDLKPANVLLDPLGIAKIADLGVAMLQDTEGPHRVVGTPTWMAPEQARGEARSPATDVFALGLLLVYAATRTFPLGSLPLDVLRGDVDAWFARSSTIESTDVAVPGLGAVIADCLWADPSRRVADASMVAAALGGMSSPPGEDLWAVLAPWRNPRAPTLGLVHSMSTIAADPSVDTTIPTNIGVHVDPFFGRADLLRAVVGQLADDRVITLRGPGGSGKTRLATQVGLEMARLLEGGAWLAELEHAHDELSMCSAVADALGVPLVDERPGRERVAAALGARGEVLVILDNVEQIAEVASEVIEQWARVAPRVRFLSTSRVPLHVPGERVVPLAGLRDVDAADLFRDRLARSGAATRWTPVQVERVVELLQGLPLALELAAARARMLGPEQLLTRLSSDIHVLRGRGRPERQTTLLDTVRWSWGLLQAEEQRALARLTVLSGDFSLELADALMEGLAGDALDLLEVLVDHSLLRSASEGAPQGRLGHWVAVRFFARDELAPTERDVVWTHYTAYVEAQARAWLAALHGPTDAAVRQEMLLERGHLFATASRAVAQELVHSLVPLVEGVALVASMVGPLPPAMSLLERAVRVDGLDSEEAVRLRAWRGHLLRFAGEGQRAARTLQSAASEGSTPRVRAWALAWLGSLMADQGQAGLDEAAVHLEHAIELAREAGERPTETFALAWLGSVHRDQGRRDEARRVQQRALDGLGESGSPQLRGWLESELAVLDAWEGRPTAEIRRRMERALHLLEQAGDETLQGRVHGKLASALGSRGMAEASEHAEQAVQIGASLGDRVGEGIGHEILGLQARRKGDHAQAEAHARRGLALRRASGDRLGEAVLRMHIGLALQAQGQTAEARGELSAGLVVAESIGLTRIADRIRSLLDQA